MDMIAEPRCRIAEGNTVIDSTSATGSTLVTHKPTDVAKRLKWFYNLSSHFTSSSFPCCQHRIIIRREELTQYLDYDKIQKD